MRTAPGPHDGPVHRVADRLRSAGDSYAPAALAASHLKDPLLSSISMRLPDLSRCRVMSSSLEPAAMTGDQRKARRQRIERPGTATGPMITMSYETGNVGCAIGAARSRRSVRVCVMTGSAVPACQHACFTCLLAPVAEHRQDRFVKRWKAPWETGAVRDDHVVGWLAETEVPTKTLEIGDWGRVILTPPSPTGDPGDIRVEFEDTPDARQNALTFTQTLYEELRRRSSEVCIEFVRASDHYHLLVSDYPLHLARVASSFARTISTGVLGAQGRSARSVSTSVTNHVRHRSTED